MEGARASPPAPLTSSGVSPERAISHRLVKPVRFEENTIRVPSRVHASPPMSRLSKVRRRGSPPEVGTTKISWARNPAPCTKATIRRPRRIEVFGGIGRQPQATPGADQLNIDVGIVAFFAHPRVSDLVAVWRENRREFRAGRTGERHDFQRRLLMFGGRREIEP